jgi:predicted lipid-binding transport protein (Tim44 family)
MDSQESQAPDRAAFGPLSEVRRLGANGAVSVAELKEFLGSLQGRSPQEVIGIVSTSMLVQSFGIAAVATTLLLAVFTIGPYLMFGSPHDRTVAAKPKPAAATPADQQANLGSAATAGATAAGPSDNAPNAQRAADVMGLNDTKAADPNTNPLDGPNIDNLLDGID